NDNFIEENLTIKPITALELLNKEKNETKLLIGDEIIDKILNGGIEKGITEIVGESGSGKTILGLQLLFQCQLPINNKGMGINSKSIYITTESMDGLYNRIELLNKYYKNLYKELKIEYLNNIFLK